MTRLFMAMMLFLASSGQVVAPARAPEDGGGSRGYAPDSGDDLKVGTATALGISKISSKDRFVQLKNELFGDLRAASDAEKSDQVAVEGIDGKWYSLSSGLIKLSLIDKGNVSNRVISDKEREKDSSLPDNKKSLTVFVDGIYSVRDLPLLIAQLKFGPRYGYQIWSKQQELFWLRKDLVYFYFQSQPFLDYMKRVGVPTDDDRVGRVKVPVLSMLNDLRMRLERSSYLINFEKIDKNASEVLKNAIATSSYTIDNLRELRKLFLDQKIDIMSNSSRSVSGGGYSLTELRKVFPNFINYDENTYIAVSELRKKIKEETLSQDNSKNKDKVKTIKDAVRFFLAESELGGIDLQVTSIDTDGDGDFDESYYSPW